MLFAAESNNNDDCRQCPGCYCKGGQHSLKFFRQSFTEMLTKWMLYDNVDGLHEAVEDINQHSHLLFNLRTIGGSQQLCYVRPLELPEKGWIIDLTALKLESATTDLDPHEEAVSPRRQLINRRRGDLDDPTAFVKPKNEILELLRNVFEDRRTTKIVLDCRPLTKVLCANFELHMIKRNTVDLQVFDSINRNDLFGASADGKTLDQLTSFYGITRNDLPNDQEDNSGLPEGSIDQSVRMDIMERLYNRIKKQCDQYHNRVLRESDEKIDNALVKSACRHALNFR